MFERSQGKLLQCLLLKRRINNYTALKNDKEIMSNIIFCVMKTISRFLFSRGLSDKMLKNKRLTKHLSLASSDKMVGEFVLRSATEVNKLLWYTFNTLVDSHDGTAHISTLKVNSAVETYRCTRFYG